MLLEVDMGNTYIKWRLVDTSGVRSSGRALTAQEVFDWFVPLSARFQIREVLVSCVAQMDKVEILRQVVLGVSPDMPFRVALVANEWFGVRFAYKDVSRLGVDRALVMVAAYRRCPEGVMVIDAGSAITADLVDRSGQHLGGYIMPGLPLLASALARDTAQLPLVQDSASDVQPGNSTASCIASGVLMMAVGALDALCELARVRGIETVLITGGDGAMLARHAKFRMGCHPDLVFEGLEWVFGFKSLVGDKVRATE